MRTIIRTALVITAFTMLASVLCAAKSGNAAGKEGKKSEAAGVTATVGKIAAIDAKARTLSVDGREFIIAEKCTFIGSDNRNDLSIKNFKVGDTVTVTYETTKGVHTASIIAQTSTGKGSKAEKVAAGDKGTAAAKETEKKETEKKKAKSKKTSTN